MPDYTYHPFFKPLFFLFPGEDARRLTMGLLSVQARTSIGRRIFRLFGHGVPPASLAVEAFGVRFPGPMGVAPGIDIEGKAPGVLQYLGVGFVSVGPVSSEEVPRSPATDPLRVRDAAAIVSSNDAFGPAAQTVAQNVASAGALEVPIVAALRGPDLAAAARALEGAAHVFTVPASSANDEASLRTLREATKRPILLALSVSWDDAEVDRAVDLAIALGLDGVVAVEGERTHLLSNGSITGPFLRRRALEVIARVHAKAGPRLPIVASGGILTPDDALSALDAGASLVSLYEGLVFGGPALPGRIVHLLEHRLAGEVARPEPVREPAPREAASLHAWGCRMLAFTALVLIASGIAALVLASTVTFFPYDYAFLGMTAEELCQRNACRIVHFMKHDRVSFGGAILSIGIVYFWLARKPLRDGEPWAFWVFLLSGFFGFASFLLYLGYGYLDVWHGRATLALLPFFVGGLTLSFAGLSRPRSPLSLFRPGSSAYVFGPAGMGRAGITFAALGMIFGGLVIMFVGVTRVFVPTDLAYIGLTAEELRAISPKLVPLIAHDRAGFGGGLFSGGLTILFSLWCGAKPGNKGLFWALLLAGVVGFGSAIGVHPLVGYTSFVHLLPAYAGALAFLWGAWLLWKPIFRESGSDRFADYG